MVLFQWPISISEVAGSDKILVLLSGDHLITQALGKFTPSRSLRACHPCTPLAHAAKMAEKWRNN
jgi:hypothetical protein